MSVDIIITVVVVSTLIAVGVYYTVREFKRKFQLAMLDMLVYTMEKVEASLTNPELAEVNEEVPVILMVFLAAYGRVFKKEQQPTIYYAERCVSFINHGMYITYFCMDTSEAVRILKPRQFTKAEYRRNIEEVKAIREHVDRRLRYPVNTYELIPWSSRNRDG